MEFFLVLPLVVLVLAAGLQAVKVTMTQMELVGAARDGARIAATTPDPARAVQAVLDALPAAMRDRVRVSVSRPSVVGHPARVTIQFRHRLGTPFPESMGFDLSASASMVVEK